MKNTVKFTIQGRLPSLNDYCKAERSGYHAANNMKHRYQELISAYIRRARLKPIKYKMKIIYRFYKKKKKRDKGYVSEIAHKFIQDALVNDGILKDDGWDYITGFSYEFYLDRNNPRIEVILCKSTEKK